MLLSVVTGAQAVVVYTTDFSSAGASAGGSAQNGATLVSDNISGMTAIPISTTDYTSGGNDYSFVNVTAAHGVSGQWLRGDAGGLGTVTIALNNLPTHSFLSIDLFAAAGGGLDAPRFTDPSDPANDSFQINVDGNDLLSGDEIHFFARGDRDFRGNLIGTTLEAPSDAGPGGSGPSGRNGSEFLNNRQEVWGHDALFDLGTDGKLTIPHTASSVTLTLSTTINGDGLGDEIFALANVVVDTSVPEPSSTLLGVFGVSMLALRRRR